MSQSRKIADQIKNFFTWLCSGLSAFVLLAILIFVFSKGWKILSWDLLTGDFWSQNINAAFTRGAPADYKAPANLTEDEFFSQKYGFALKQYRNVQKEEIMEITYVDPHSPILNAVITTAGDMKGKPMGLSVGSHLKKITYVDSAGEKHSAGLLGGHNAERCIAVLDQEAASIDSYYAQSKGGGIRGSVITTLMLIAVTLAISLPIGVGAAVYLNELAPKNKMTAFMRSSIEMLAGVPSIIFGLMGMTMLYPITKLFGIDGQSILLGALTLAVILLPVIIRQTEEALKVVPNGMRMASLSLGATMTQTIFKVILPNALPGILSACLLSISRIIGESAALIYTMGTAIADHPALNNGATSLAVQIWSIMSGEQPNFQLASAISLVILALVLVLNLSVKWISYRLNRKWA